MVVVLNHGARVETCVDVAFGARVEQVVQESAEIGVDVGEMIVFGKDGVIGGVEDVEEVVTAGEGVEMVGDGMIGKDAVGEGGEMEIGIAGAIVGDLAKEISSTLTTAVIAQIEVVLIMFAALIIACQRHHLSCVVILQGCGKISFFLQERCIKRM